MSNVSPLSGVNAPSATPPGSGVATALHLPTLDPALLDEYFGPFGARMSSRDSSTKPGSGAADPVVPNLSHQRMLRPDPPVRSVEEFVAFLVEIEAIVGVERETRKPTTGDRFLL